VKPHQSGFIEMKKETKYVLHFYGLLLLETLIGFLVGLLGADFYAGLFSASVMWAFTGFVFGSHFYQLYVKEPGLKFRSLNIIRMKAVLVPFAAAMAGLFLAGLMLYRIIIK
jgi:hypothetical protein